MIENVPRAKLLSIQGLLAAAILAGLFATALGFAGSYHWTMDLFAHFRVQLAMGAAGLMCFALLLRRWRSAALALLGFVVNAGAVAPLYVHQCPTFTQDMQILKVLYANVLTKNDQYGDLQRLIEQEQPHVIALLEYSSDWQAALEPALDAYPHRVVRPRSDNFGIALYSRYPIKDVSWPVLTPTGSETLFATLSWNDKDIPFILVHPYPPIRRYASTTARLQIRALCQRVELKSELALLVGDLNATPWSDSYRQLDKTGLRNARTSFGVLPTWPASLPELLRIPIDGLLTGPGLQVLSLDVGPDIGSDHLPLISTLSLQVPELDTRKPQ